MINDMRVPQKANIALLAICGCAIVLCHVLAKKRSWSLLGYWPSAPVQTLISLYSLMYIPLVG